LERNKLELDDADISLSGAVDEFVAVAVDRFVITIG
jgi:hypothetical protein